MKEPAKITGFSIQDFKRIRLVEIHPTENGLTILGGRNAQGKSSCLDAIAYALGGESFRPSDINNHDGEKNAAIRVEIDGLIVERTGKNAALKITDARGMRGNQTLLNDIVGKFALDLGAFMRAGDLDKAKMLLKMFPILENSLAEMKKRADEIREIRADQNRDIKRAQIHFDEMPNYPDLPTEEIKIEALTKELQEAAAAETESANRRNLIAAEQKKAEELKAKLEAYTRQEEFKKQDLEHNQKQFETEMLALENEFNRRKEDLKTRYSSTEKNLRDEIFRIMVEAQNTKNEIANQNEELEQLSANMAGEPDYAAIKAGIMNRIQQADETNRKIRANAERRKVYGEISEMRKNADAKTAELQEIEAERTALLQNAELPLPELSITTDGELLYRGQKWDCMSGAERLKVATAICMKSKPGCGFVLIDGLEAMDPQTLAEFNEYLTAQNMQGIGTIVGDNAATIIIEDGIVQEQNTQPKQEEK